MKLRALDNPGTIFILPYANEGFAMAFIRIMGYDGQGLHEILCNKKARFFYKWFINGGATSLFSDILMLAPYGTEAEASRLSRNVESYCKGLYQEELRYGAFKKSFGAFLDEPRVIAVSINYIARTLLSEYPEHGHQILNFIKSKLSAPRYSQTCIFLITCPYIV